jgi:hypothetical protein
MAMNFKKLVTKSFRSQDGDFVPFRSAPASR